MQFYNNVARLRQFVGAKGRERECRRAETGALAAAAAINLDFQIADFLSQGVAVNP
jgi:hypothetical protein